MSTGRTAPRTRQRSPQTVRDVMRHGLITCRPTATLGEIARKLVEHEVHAVFVAERDVVPRGVVSDTDLLAGEWLVDGHDPDDVMRTMTAEEIMTAPVKTVDADAPATQAARLLRTRGVARLVVVDDGRATGVISVADVVAASAAPPARPATVAEAMARAVVTCLADTTIAAAARAMTERHSRSLLVVARDGGPVGVVTGHDLLAVFEGAVQATTVAEVMSTELVSIRPDAPLREAVALMIEQEVPRLLVTDGADARAFPCGLLSTADISVEMAAPSSLWTWRPPS